MSDQQDTAEPGASKVSVQDLSDSIDSGNFKTTMLNLFNEVVNLEVKTILSSQQADGDETISTTINLLDGDITNTIPKSLIEPAQAIDFHLQQVVKAEQIIKSNIETLKSLANTIKEGLD